MAEPDPAPTAPDAGQNSASAVPGSGSLTEKSERLFTQAELETAIKDRLARQKAALDADAERTRKAAADTELAEQGKHKERADAALARVAALEAAQATALSEMRTTRLDALVTRLAGRLDLVDADAALRLMDASAVEWADDKPTEASVEAALTALIKARPYLIRAAAPPPTPRGGAPTSPARGGSGALTLELIRAMTPQEYGARRTEIQDFLAQRR